jgi:hypothetical protein
MDLADPQQRDRLRDHLGGLLRGRKTISGIGPLAGLADFVAIVEQSGAQRPLVLATGVGAGPTPTPDQAEIVLFDVPPAPSVTEDLRRHDAIVRDLPDPVVAALDAYDPRHEALWVVGPFIGTEPIFGRQVPTGRPARWLALEDKLVADRVWDAVGAPRAASRVVAVDGTALREASAELDDGDGVVWAGDARDGFNGGGDFVRWVASSEDAAAALAFFAVRCDRVRVMPFIDGVPCSIHGLVLPDGTAAFRPVELAVLRGTDRRFVIGGQGTTWDPPAADREQMRGLVRLVGEHLRDAVGYRGAFGIDGVLGRDGFRPTELNTRLAAGLMGLARHLDATLVQLVQLNLLAGRDPGVDVDSLEQWALPALDAQRFARPIAVSNRPVIEEPVDVPVAWSGAVGTSDLVRSDADGDWSVSAGPNPAGTYARLVTPVDGTAGVRVAELNVALMRFLDRELGTGFGEVQAPPDVRRPRVET